MEIDDGGAAAEEFASNADAEASSESENKEMNYNMSNDEAVLISLMQRVEKLILIQKLTSRKLMSQLQLLVNNTGTVRELV